MWRIIDGTDDRGRMQIEVSKKDGTKLYAWIHKDDEQFIQNTVRTMYANPDLGGDYYIRCNTFDGRRLYLHQLIAMHHYAEEYDALRSVCAVLYVDHIDRNKLNNDYHNLRPVTPRVSAENRRRPSDPPGEPDGVTSIRFNMTNEGLVWEGSHSNGLRAKTKRRPDDAASTASMIHFAFNAFMKGMAESEVKDWFVNYGWTSERFIEYGFDANELDRIIQEAVNDLPNGFRPPKTPSEFNR